MAGSGFGFGPYPPKPSVPPQSVGQMLMQRQAMQQGPTGPGPGPGPGGPAPSGPMGPTGPTMPPMMPPPGADATAVAPMATASGNPFNAMHDMALAAYPGMPGGMKPEMMRDAQPMKRPGQMPMTTTELGIGEGPFPDTMEVERPWLADMEGRSYLPLTDVKIGGDESVPSNLNILSREAAQRQIGKMVGQQQAPPPPFRDEQLRRLGMSEMEIALMKKMGGLK